MVDKIDGEIYVDTKHTPGNIFMWSSKIRDAKYYTSGSRTGFDKNGGSFNLSSPFRLATFEEREWLLTMIKANKFIEFSDMKFEKGYELW